MLNIMELVAFIEEASKSTLDVPELPPLPSSMVQKVVQPIDYTTLDLFTGLISNRFRGLMNRHAFSNFSVGVLEENNPDSLLARGSFILSIQIHPTITRNILFSQLSFDSIYVRGHHYRNDRLFYLKLFGREAVELLESWAFGVQNDS